MKQLIYLFLFFSASVNATQSAINIKRLESEQSVAQLVALQKNMHMSVNPKELFNDRCSRP
jgi:hypothetical protein